MVPSLEHVIKKRHHNRRRLRFLALVLVLIGVIFAACGLFVALLVEHEWPTLSAWTAIGAAFVLPTFPLWLLDERLARALVPMPQDRCPQCRYDLTGLERPLCPECGLALPAALLPTSGLKASGNASLPTEEPAVPGAWRPLKRVT